MKLLDRITYITFGVNIAVILFYFIALPIILITIPDAIDISDVLDKISANKGYNPYNLGMTGISMIAFFHWIYCVWFLFKYDRYSKSIFPLFFLTALYAPIYFYRVRIKKRPLRNKIYNPYEEITTENKGITDDEF